MAQITFLNVGNDDYSVHAHAAGCRDIARTLRKSILNEEAGTGEYATQRSAFEDYNADFLDEDPTGESSWDIKFLPCCKIPKQ